MTETMTATPVVRSMQVIPVAGCDSMLLNLCGAHAPYFTRNLVLLEDSAGRTGIGEVPGGEGIRLALERSRELVIGQPIGRYNRTLNALRRAIAGNASGTPQATRHEVTSEAEAAVLRQPHEINLRLDNVLTAVEAALLDLLGQHLGVPVAELLGAGQQRERVPMLAYLFYIGDRTRTDLPYLASTGENWYHLRHQQRSRPRRSPARPSAPPTATASAISSSRAGLCTAARNCRRWPRSRRASPTPRDARPERRLVAGRGHRPVQGPGPRPRLRRRPLRP